jgi:hypothetical protein
MKRFLFFAVCLFVTNLVWSQDVLTLQSGEEVKVKVVEVTSNELKYKKFENLNGPVYNMSLKNVFMIAYENGSKDIFNSSKYADDEVVNNSFDSYNEGKNDASIYYKSYKACGTGTLVTSLLSPLLGLIPAVACSVVPPSDDNLGFPSYEKMKNTDYSQGYKNKARKIKTAKVWTNWGIGLGVNVALLFLLL